MKREGLWLRRRLWIEPSCWVRDTEKSLSSLEGFTAGQERVPMPGLCNLYLFFFSPRIRSPGAAPLGSSALAIAALCGFLRPSLLIGCYSPSAISKYNLKGKNPQEHLQLLWERCSMLALYLITTKLQTSSLLMDYRRSFSLFKHIIYMLANSYLLNAMNRFGMFHSQTFS